jgi:hypothetical protein
MIYTHVLRAAAPGMVGPLDRLAPLRATGTAQAHALIPPAAPPSPPRA